MDDPSKPRKERPSSAMPPSRVNDCPPSLSVSKTGHRQSWPYTGDRASTSPGISSHLTSPSPSPGGQQHAFFSPPTRSILKGDECAEASSNECARPETITHARCTLCRYLPPAMFEICPLVACRSLVPRSWWLHHALHIAVPCRLANGSGPGITNAYSPIDAELSLSSRLGTCIHAQQLVG